MRSGVSRYVRGRTQIPVPINYDAACEIVARSAPRLLVRTVYKTADWANKVDRVRLAETRGAYTTKSCWSSTF